jgi:hypothetical protein
LGQRLEATQVAKNKSSTCHSLPGGKNLARKIRKAFRGSGRPLGGPKGLKSESSTKELEEDL